METHLTVYDGKQRQQIPLSKIEYLSGVANYTLIHLRDQGSILLSFTLKKMEGRLPGFLRIHKRTLVNPAHITAHSIQKSRESVVTLTGGRKLAVARRRTALILTHLCKP